VASSPWLALAVIALALAFVEPEARTLTAIVAAVVALVVGAIATAERRATAPAKEKRKY
jgi:hypothetical protein